MTYELTMAATVTPDDRICGAFCGLCQMNHFQKKYALSSLILLAAVVMTDAASAEERILAAQQKKLTREQVIEQTMKPFEGKSEKGVYRSKLTGKVMCGYQGWHAAEGDGCGRGWYHWAGKNGFKPGSTNVDLWPDVSELDADERYPTAFRTKDSKVAEVYSAF